MRARRNTWLKALFCALGALLCAFPATAQAPLFDATHLSAPSELNTQWLVHAGDDLAYAQPDFDDSHWTRFDPSTSLVNLYGATRPPIIWYRLRVKVDPSMKDLALDEFDICRAFEIYVNGRKLLTNGSVVPYRGYSFLAHMRARIPDELVQSGMLVIALRVHLTRAEWTSGQNPGYFVSNLTIGQASTLYRFDWLEIISKNVLAWITSTLFIGLGIVALMLFFAQRNQVEYLWVAAVCAISILQSPWYEIPVIVNIPVSWEIASAFLRLASPYLWGSMYFSFVRQRVGWRWRAYFIFAGIADCVSGLEAWLFTSAQQYQMFINLPYVILLAVIIPIVLAIHWRRGNREAGILLIPVVLLSLYSYLQFIAVGLFQFSAWKAAAIRLFILVNQFPVGPFEVSLGTLSSVFSIIALAIIILLRSSRMSRRQAQLESEMEAAQQVQQVLVPEKTSSVPGFKMDAVYLPAQQVGGDFFQILPAGNGGLLVVVGDVAGKGLPAAMLVSALVGSIRTAADDTHAPEAVLQRLNDRLTGRTQGGFTTALAAYIARDGAVTIANAGHLSPYLDGKEVELPGALPLGVVAQAHYETRQLYLLPGSRLTFYSDGVIEAQNHHGELLGFERGRELSVQTAEAIAHAAEQFGQRDDITVVTIERERIAATAA